MCHLCPMRYCPTLPMQNFATTLGSREQLAIGEFAAAMLVLPKTLAVNAAKDATVGSGPCS